MRAKAHTNLGSLYFRHKRLDVAMEEANVAIDADSGYHQAWILRALIYNDLGEKQKAIADSHHALSLAPEDPETNNNHGWILCDAGQHAAAEPYFKKAALTPLYKTPGLAYANAGLCSQRAGDMTKAKSYFLRALKITNQKEPKAHLGLAEYYLLQGRYNLAKKHLQANFRQTNPPSSKALLTGIRLANSLGDRQMEQKYAKQLRRQHPDSAEFKKYLESTYQ